MRRPLEEELRQWAGHIRFFGAHLNAVHAAIDRGAENSGYFAQSLTDIFEIGEDYSTNGGYRQIA